VVHKTISKQNERLKINLDAVVKTRDSSYFEERNKVLLDSVRRNISSIDRIVNKANRTPGICREGASVTEMNDTDNLLQNNHYQ